MAQTQFLNPIVPFVAALVSGSKKGSIVNIHGRSFLSADKICIDFILGSGVNPTEIAIALHIALDFKRNLIVRNSIEGTIMGNEETHGPPVNLVGGQPFQLDIRCDENDYKIYFNGVYYTKMEPRINKCTNDYYLAVHGDTKMYSIQINDIGLVLPGQFPIPRQLLMSEQMDLPEMPIREETPKLTMTMFTPPGMNVHYSCFAFNPVDTGNYPAFN